MVHLSTSRIFQLAPSGWGSIDPRRKNRSSKQRRNDAGRGMKIGWLCTSHLNSRLMEIDSCRKKNMSHRHTNTHTYLFTHFERTLFVKKLFSKIIFGIQIFQGPIPTHPGDPKSGQQISFLLRVTGRELFLSCQCHHQASIPNQKRIAKTPNSVLIMANRGIGCCNVFWVSVGRGEVVDRICEGQFIEWFGGRVGEMPLKKLQVQHLRKNNHCNGKCPFFPRHKVSA